jgi:hypothetical protein
MVCCYLYIDPLLDIICMYEVFLGVMEHNGLLLPSYRSTAGYYMHVQSVFWCDGT